MIDHSQAFDGIGIGFGPSNISVAIALEESGALKNDQSWCFLEKKPEFEWHGGMLLDGTRMQISYLKDLVTLRNPTSKYTFANYLHENNRLSSFINMGTFFPARLEFNDYLKWAAGKFERLAKYSHTVIAIEPVEENGGVEWLRVISQDGAGNQSTRYARNLIIGAGGAPKLPPQFEGKMGTRVLHSSQYKQWLDAQSALGEKPKIAVIGAGQSGAEIFVNLTNRFPAGQIDLINRNRALHPSDDSPFVNEVFDPEFTDEMFSKKPEERSNFLQRFSNTNYSVVDMPELNEIYERLYLQRVTGVGNHRYLANRDITDVAIGSDGLPTLALKSNIDSVLQQQEKYDAVVLATGYRYDGYKRMLEAVDPWLTGGVERCYRIASKPNFKPSIYLQGYCESSHGLSDTLLSVMAIRSQEIIDSLDIAEETMLKAASI